jgi:hypothetical protein
MGGGRQSDRTEVLTMTKLTVVFDDDNPIFAADFPHAYRTGWAWDREAECYVLTLHGKDGKVFAAASYTWEHWQEVFQQLSEARASILLQKGKT